MPAVIKSRETLRQETLAKVAKMPTTQRRRMATLEMLRRGIERKRA